MPNSKKTKVLGRGLEEILQQEKTLQQQLEFIQQDISRPQVFVNIEQVMPNPFFKEKKYSDSQLEELVISLKEDGFILPVLVRKVEQNYEIISGEKRRQAALRAGLEKMPVIIESFSDDKMKQIFLIEQSQQDNATPLEEALAYKYLIEEHGYSHQYLAHQIGKSRVYITNLLRVLTLPSYVIEAIEKNEISFSHARTLVGQSEKTIKTTLKKIIKEQLSVRQTEKLLQKEQEGYKVVVNEDSVVVYYDDQEQLEKILKKLKS